MDKDKRHAFKKDIYLLGKDSFGTLYWLEEPSWHCSWYWGFGYVETYTNNEYPELSKDIKSHEHFDSLFLKGNKVYLDAWKDIFVESPFTEKEVWKIMELMKTAYTLKETAELYHIGGSNVTSNPLKGLLENETAEVEINSFLLPHVFLELENLLKGEKK